MSVQCEKEASGCVFFHYVERAFKKAGEGLVIKACSDRTRGKAFSLSEKK